MIAEENNNVMCKTKLNHSPSTTSIGSIDLCTFANEHQNDRDFQNRSQIQQKDADGDAFKILSLPMLYLKRSRGWVN